MAMEAQLQIRQNAMEMQEYMKDLYDWEKSIKKKDKGVKTEGAAGAHAAPMHGGGGPAPRGRAVTSAVQAAPASMQAPGVMPQARPAAAAAGTSGPGAHAAAAAPPAMQPSGGTSTTQKKKKKAASQRAAGSAAQHTYAGYSKWDKIDVDAMLQSDDEAGSGSEYESEDEAPPQQPQQPPPSQQPQQPAASSSVGVGEGGGSGGGITIAPREACAPAEMSERSTVRSAPPAAAPGTSSATGAARELPPVRNLEPTTSDAWRAHGNDLYKVGQFASALECYSRSVELEPSCVAYANRAMARLKLEQWADAEIDCTEAISHDATFTKAYHRRGTARRKLGQTMSAAEDFEAALRLEPTNTGVRQERDNALRDAMAAEGLKEPCKRTRVHVHVPAAPPLSSSTASSTAVPAAARDISINISASLPARGADAVVSAAVDAAMGAAETAPAPASAPPRVLATSTAAAAASAVAAAAASAMRPPKTSTDFESSWRSLGGDPMRQAQYCRLLDPPALPAVFKSSLTPQLLSQLVRTVLVGMAAHDGSTSSQEEAAGSQCGGAGGAGLDPAHAAALLLHLSRCPRFDMTAMCVPGKERAALGAAWDAAAASAAGGAAALSGSGTDLASLRAKYRV